MPETDRAREELADSAEFGCRGMVPLCRGARERQEGTHGDTEAARRPEAVSGQEP